jgi:hypothetical protein
MNSPVRSMDIFGEIGAGEIRGVVDIETGDRDRNLELLAQMEMHRSVLEAELGPLDFLEGNHRCRIVKRLPWEGKLLTQPERHDEARAWFDETLRAFRGALETVAPNLRTEEE